MIRVSIIKGTLALTLPESKTPIHLSAPEARDLAHQLLVHAERLDRTVVLPPITIMPRRKHKQEGL